MTGTCCGRGWWSLTAVAIAVAVCFHVALGRVGRRMCTGEYEFPGAVGSDKVDIIFLQNFSCTLEQ